MSNLKKIVAIALNKHNTLSSEVYYLVHLEVPRLPSLQYLYHLFLPGVLVALMIMKYVNLTTLEKLKLIGITTTEMLTWGSLATWPALSADLSRKPGCPLGPRITWSSIVPWGPRPTWRCYHFYWHLYPRHIVGHSLWEEETWNNKTTIPNWWRL